MLRVAFFSLLFAAGLCLPSLAMEWQNYSNARYGYSIDLPKSFSGKGESDNGGGQTFVSDNGREQLLVWGGEVMDTDFSTQTARTIAGAKGEGLRITYEATTPTWASYSGIRSGRIVYVRMIALCQGRRYAAFQLEYPKRDMDRFDRVIDKLVRSLDGPKSC